MNALDGNAMAGVLAEALGSDVSGLLGRCGDCGSEAPVGAQRAWLRAPGAVLRCAGCDAVLVVVVEVRDVHRVTFERLAWLEGA